MKKLKFYQLQKENEGHYELLLDLMIPYYQELDSYKPEQTISEDFIEKISRSSLNMQGDFDRHLELCYLGDDLIGFLYGKVDRQEHKGHKKVGFGYVMEFYVKPEYRKRGYGRAMFYRLENLFAADGVKRMYLNTSTETGVKFWTSLGFIETKEIQPHNNLPIYEKPIGYDVDIFVTNYLLPGYAEKITTFQWHRRNQKTISGLRRFMSDGKFFSDSFSVYAENSEGELVGRLYCLRNQEDKNLWYYGDLAVKPSYRRRKIASRMFEHAKRQLTELGAKSICTYVDPTNVASLALQYSLGFKECPYTQFDNLINDGQIMFTLDIPSSLNVIRATAEEAWFVFRLYSQNKDLLHGEDISYNKWQEILANPDPNESHFIILKGELPVGWLNISSLQGKDTVWISALFIHPDFQGQGIGSFAISFAESFAKEKGFTCVKTHINVDNDFAQKSNF